MTDKILNAAISDKFSKLVEMGFNVIPVIAKSKTPAIKWKDHQDRKPTDEEIASWEKSDFNVAVVTGKSSNVAVFDVDGPDAQARMDSLNLPRTPTVKTGKGRHYYFRLDDAVVPNKVDIEGIKLDVRGEGGYVVAPGSVHENGSVYEWEVSPADTPLATIPAQLLALLAPKSKALVVRSTRLTPERRLEPARFDDFLNSELEKAVKRQSEVTEGGRNNWLFKNAVRLANHVAAAGADWHRFASRLKIEAEYGGLNAEETDATLASAWKAASFRSVSWIHLANEWMYVATADSFFHVESGQQLTPKAFSTVHSELNAFERKSLADNLTSRGFIDKVHDFTFDPSLPRGVVERGGLRLFNKYQPANIEPVEGDATPFIEFMEYLVPNEYERVHLLKMIAWTVRNPHKKLRHALLLASTGQGIGKSMMVDIWRKLLGERNTRKTTSDEISSLYQSWIKDAVLVLVEELNLGVGPKAYNSIKDLITGDVVAINEKYQVQREYPNHASFVFLSNLDSPMLIENDDRRFFYIRSDAERREKDYYQVSADWWQGNLDVIAGFLHTIDLSNFDRSAPPPETDAKAELRSASVPQLDEELMALMSDRRHPFVRDIGTIEEVRGALPPFLQSRSRNQIGNALKRLGAAPLGDQLRVPGRWTLGFFMSGESLRISPWAFRNCEHWMNASTEERVAEYASRESTLCEPATACRGGATQLELVSG